MPRSPLPYWSVPTPAPVLGFEPPGVVSVFFSLPHAEISTASAPAAPVPPTAFRKRRRDAGSAASSSTALVSSMRRGSNQIAEPGAARACPAGRSRVASRGGRHALSTPLAAHRTPAAAPPGGGLGA